MFENPGGRLRAEVSPEQVVGCLLTADCSVWAELRSVSCRAARHRSNLWDIDRLQSTDQSTQTDHWSITGTAAGRLTVYSSCVLKYTLKYSYFTWVFPFSATVYFHSTSFTRVLVTIYFTDYMLSHSSDVDQVENGSPPHFLLRRSRDLVWIWRDYNPSHFNLTRDNLLSWSSSVSKPTCKLPQCWPGTKLKLLEDTDVNNPVCSSLHKHTVLTTFLFILSHTCYSAVL